MAIFRGTIRSDVLGMDTGLCIVLPYDRPAEEQQEPCKVLYLLHGLGDNCDAWTRYTAVERYAREEGFALIMPEVQRSFYFDMAHGGKFFAYVTEELPALCARMFRFSVEREDTFIAGLSMGGYGAMKCGLTFPEKYAGCASFSGVLDIGYVLEKGGEGHREEMKSVYGMELSVQPENDLYLLAEKLAERPAAERPKVMITCGQQDFIYHLSTAFRDKLNRLGIEHLYREWPGEHTWDVWDKSAEMALRHFCDKSL